MPVAVTRLRPQPERDRALAVDEGVCGDIGVSGATPHQNGGPPGVRGARRHVDVAKDVLRMVQRVPKFTWMPSMAPVEGPIVVYSMSERSTSTSSTPSGLFAHGALDELLAGVEQPDVADGTLSAPAVPGSRIEFP